MSATQPTRDVTGVGEGQLRLDTPLGIPLDVTDTLSLRVAGTEGNVLGLLARLGNSTGLVTSLPIGPLGRRVADEYRAAGIDTSAIIWRDRGRVALYFLERSSQPVPSRVLYDRAESCFAQLTVDDVDWDYVGDSRLLHLTGITAALTDHTYAIVARAAEQARHTGQLLSVDVNYRRQLSSPSQACDRLSPLLASAAVISCSRRDAETVFGVTGEVASVARALSDRFEASCVLVSDGPREAAAITEGTVYTGQPPPTTVIDRVGAGDAFIGGFLHGFLQGDPESGLRLGIAAASLALTRYGDQVRTTLADLTNLTGSFSQDIVR